MLMFGVYKHDLGMQEAIYFAFVRSADRSKTEQSRVYYANFYVDDLTIAPLYAH